MLFKETKLKGVYLIELEKINDKRGFFSRLWCKRELEELNLNANVVQSNISYNKKKGTLRGLHFQKAPYEETKYVRCTQGAIYDVVVDLRPDSPTYKQWLGIELSEKNETMLYVPEGFAHGYLALEDHSEVTYFVTQFYQPDAEGGVRYDDPGFQIEWPIPVTEISDKDKNRPDYKG
ncbi:dTDP-4-dehydrorhamnose 3,5-epimerase [Aureibaculum marinum]|uniref:dTDP-4-dehydrorhamnose 3,5-epimerase n=1 Tax=Aureibaculum marinum TaxID=2487930 RepID=A0A3N4NDT9_9FLAO|nr:dTDP-4-dehydrorhamnose 3,5-epimerase [Aureibaculum marinum]RPD94361.1 dTDP-4-dehydrorhamnose 3,5-epimerase [Aureibaculum marinum]